MEEEWDGFLKGVVNGRRVGWIFEGEEWEVGPFYSF